MTELERRAYDVLRQNRVERRAFAYTRPGGKYHSQWFWDSCFHAMVWRHVDPDFAKRELESAFRFQEESGFTPHLTFHRAPLLARWLWGRPGSSGLIQPPVAADAAWAVYEIDHDRDFLQRIYPQLARYYAFLARIRDHDCDHLFSYVHPWESGWDQAITWDFAFGGRRASKYQLWRMTLPFRAVAWDQHRMMTHAEFNVESADGNALLACNLVTLARIARTLGRETEATDWEADAATVEEAILTDLWDGEMFLDRCVIRTGHHMIRKRTPVAFFALLLPHLTSAHRKRLLQVLTEEFLVVPWPLPTASPRELKFDPNAYWRGTTWVNVNYFVILGLWQQGEEALGNELMWKTVRLVERSGFREYYNPLTGRGLGVRDFSWSTLVVDLLRRAGI